MASINKDSDSWKARGIKKRDFNHAHDEPEVPKKRKNKKKDTKRWCRGKEGREHDVQEVAIVPFNDKCFTNERCGHWRHHETKCVNCGMISWNLPREAKAQVDPDLQRQIELEEKWCTDGHLMDWESNLVNFPEIEEKDDFGWFNWSRRYWEYKVCAMCGKRGKSRRRYQQ